MKPLFDRRATLLTGGAMCIAPILGSCATRLPAHSADVLPLVDHLVYVTPNLEQSIDEIERLLGVRASIGGSHPGGGTRNALLALGPASYLEIMGPDPSQPNPPQGRVFGIDQLEKPRLATWIAKTMDVPRVVRDARAAGVPLGDIWQGSRRRTDGVLLSWNMTDPTVVLGDGLVPLFIDWGSSPHPAANATKGATLTSFRGEHPQPAAIEAMLRPLQVPLAVTLGSEPRIIATIDTPKGAVELA